MAEDQLDLTDHVRAAAANARAAGRDTLVLVVSADNCPGCERLEE